MEATISNQISADCTIPGFLNSWEMLIKSTRPGIASLELAVQLVAFEDVAFQHVSSKTPPWLWLPKHMDLSLPSRRAEFVFGRLAARYALA